MSGRPIKRTLRARRRCGRGKGRRCVGGSIHCGSGRWDEVTAWKRRAGVSQSSYARRLQDMGGTQPNCFTAQLRCLGDHDGVEP